MEYSKNMNKKTIDYMSNLGFMFLFILINFSSKSFFLFIAFDIYYFLYNLK